MTDERPAGIISAIVEKFLGGQLAILLIGAALCLGVAAIVLTAREEDPQIVVPMADVHVQLPGASAEEVEKLVATPLERLLWQIDGVEYVYSTSRRNVAVVTVRFFVGEDRERSLVKLRNKIDSNLDAVPPGVSGWLVRPVEIDDVPVVTVALYSQVHDDHVLRRVAEEVRARLDAIGDLSGTRIVGGRRQEVGVMLLPEEMASRGVSALEVERALALADASLSASGFDRENQRVEVVSGPFLESANDVGALVVGVQGQKPVYLRDVARIAQGPAEPTHYTRIGFGPASDEVREQRTYAAVTLAVAKKKGVNTVDVARAVLAKLEELEPQSHSLANSRPGDAQLRANGGPEGRRPALFAGLRDDHRDRSAGLGPWLARGLDRCAGGPD